MKTEIEKRKYDSDHFILLFSKDGKDCALSFLVCVFVNEMELLLYDCRTATVDGRTGFVFPNTPKALPVRGQKYMDCLYADIECFVTMYHLDD